MRTILRRRLAALLGTAAIAGTLLGTVAAPVALAADAGCTALGGSEAAGTCTVGAGTVTVSGTITVNLNLVLQNGAHLDATGSGTTPALTLTVNGNMTMENGSILEADDDSPPLSGDSAPAKDLTIHVTGNLVMDAGSRISADNNVKLGEGGEILIDVDGDMTMHGTPDNSAPFDSCRTSTNGPAFYTYGLVKFPNVYDDPTLGAVISAHRWGGAGSSSGGHINITVGRYDVDPTGTFTMERCSLVDVSSLGSGGQIEITAGRTGEIDGLVLSESGESGVGAGQPRGGGPINIRAGCDLHVSDTGMVSSKGQDPGADLVHLKGCTVVIDGVVQSTAPGAGHVIPADGNLCNADTTTHPVGTPLRPEGYTACVRIIGQTVTIDATYPHNGQVNVDGIRAPMGGWIDVFATSDIHIIGDTPPVTNPTGRFPLWAIEADACPGGATGSPPCSNSFGGTITIKSTGGKVETDGQAVQQANASAGGSNGGLVTIEASGDVDIDGSFLEAKAPSGDNTVGGTFNIRSYNGALTSGGDSSGHIDASGGQTVGLVNTKDCTAGDQYLGTIVAGPTINDLAAVGGDCGGAPTLPQDAQTLINSNIPIWESCEGEHGGTKTGFKFKDVNKNGQFDQGIDTALADWPINLLDTSNNVLDSTTTDQNGIYEFAIPNDGTYRVCEGTGPAGYVQSYPNDDTGPQDPSATDVVIQACPAPNIWGYEFSVSGGQAVRGDDFGNKLTDVTCLKQTVLDAMNSIYANNKGPDVTVRTWLGESVQSAVDAASDTNGDNYIIVMVIAHSDGSLGGTANQKVAVTRDDYAKPFALFGCSVTLTGGGADPSVWVKDTAASPNKTINSRTTKIFVMDLHGSGSSAAGVQADGNYRYLRNEYGQNSAVGIKVNGSYNTVHNGSATGNSGDGIQITGNSNLATDTNSMSNGGNGVSVTGDNNQLLKLDVGEKGTPNTLDGIHVVGNTNTLQENDVFNNGQDGIDVAGNSNVLTKNVAGDKGKGNGWSTGLASVGIRVAGWSNNLTENKASSNKGDGFSISGGDTSAHANLLKNNLSTTSTSGNADYENAGKEWRLNGYIKNNGGGNKADSVLLANGVKGLTNFPASGATFNYAVEQTAE
jgi:hypothetical protein